MAATRALSVILAAAAAGPAERYLSELSFEERRNLIYGGDMIVP